MAKQRQDKQKSDKAVAPLKEQEQDQVSGGIATAVDLVDYVSMARA
jgi:hypothetical protein